MRFEHGVVASLLGPVMYKATPVPTTTDDTSGALIRQDACVDNFLPSEVLPCARNNRNAIYELDPDGNAYKNVYELRKVGHKFIAPAHASLNKL